MHIIGFISILLALSLTTTVCHGIRSKNKPSDGNLIIIIIPNFVSFCSLYLVYLHVDQESDVTVRVLTSQVLNEVDPRFLSFSLSPKLLAHKFATDIFK